MKIFVLYMAVVADSGVCFLNFVFLRIMKQSALR